MRLGTLGARHGQRLILPSTYHSVLCFLPTFESAHRHEAQQQLLQSEAPQLQVELCAAKPSSPNSIQC